MERYLVFILCGYIVVRFLEYKAKQKYGHLFEKAKKPRTHKSKADTPSYSGRKLAGLPIRKYGFELQGNPKSLDHQIDVLSFRDSKTVYSVNLHRLTCTCPDFDERRSSLSQSDPSRMCKHLVLASYLMRDEMESQDGDMAETIIAENLDAFIPAWAFGNNQKAG